MVIIVGADSGRDPVRADSVFAPREPALQLEPYRLVLVLVSAGWLGAMLVDPRVRLRRTGLEAPFGFLLLVSIVSALVNWDRVSTFGVETQVVKEITFLISFLVAVYLVTSLASRVSDLSYLLKFLVAGGAVVAAFVTVESATGYNAFNHLSSVTSILTAGPLAVHPERRRQRSRRSAAGVWIVPGSNLDERLDGDADPAGDLSRTGERRAGRGGGGRRASSPWERSLRSRAPAS